MAKSRQITFGQVCRLALDVLMKAKEDLREERAKAARLEQMTPSNEELLELANRFPAPQEWYEEE
jgi:hypothetical protein